MKKIFTLLLAAAIATPMISADEVTMSLYTRSDEDRFIDEKPVELIGTMKTNVSYSEASKVYSITNFLGYANGNIDFTVTDETFTSPDGEKRAAIEFSIPDNTIIRFANGIKSKYGFELNDDIDPEWDDIADVPDFDSGVFVGNDETEFEGFKLVDATFWGLNENTSNAAVNNTIPRAYAVEYKGGYKFVISVDALATRQSYGSGYNYVDYPEFFGYIIFSYPENISTGISDITVDTEAAVEYFNLQGVRVDNPTNGLYIMRQGSKTQKVSIR